MAAAQDSKVQHKNKSKKNTVIKVKKIIWSMKDNVPMNGTD